MPAHDYDVEFGLYCAIVLLVYFAVRMGTHEIDRAFGGQPIAEEADFVQATLRGAIAGAFTALGLVILFIVISGMPIEGEELIP
jgi:hypothetical protein